MGQNINFDEYNFEVVNEFVYLGTNINNTNNETEEIKKRLATANRVYIFLIYAHIQIQQCPQKN